MDPKGKEELEFIPARFGINNPAFAKYKGGRTTIYKDIYSEDGEPLPFYRPINPGVRLQTNIGDNDQRALRQVIKETITSNVPEKFIPGNIFRRPSRIFEGNNIVGPQTGIIKIPKETRKKRPEFLRAPIVRPRTKTKILFVVSAGSRTLERPKDSGFTTAMRATAMRATAMRATAMRAPVINNPFDDLRIQLEEQERLQREREREADLLIGRNMGELLRPRQRPQIDVIPVVRQENNIQVRNIVPVRNYRPRQNIPNNNQNNGAIFLGNMLPNVFTPMPSSPVERRKTKTLKIPKNIPENVSQYINPSSDSYSVKIPKLNINEARSIIRCYEAKKKGKKCTGKSSNK